MPQVEFRFYAELNDFLPGSWRQVPFSYSIFGSPAVKDVIEAIGVPHTEVELIMCQGISVGFEHRLQGGERVSVFPVFESFDVGELLRVRPEPLRTLSFVADGHLGRLVRYLRMLGFDTAWDKDATDPWLAWRSQTEKRILLTRDLGLLKRNRVTHGYYVRATDPWQQVQEVLNRFQLQARSRPFTRSLCCNQTFREIPPGEARRFVPQKVFQCHSRFFCCPGCGKLFWKGSHYEKMRQMIKELGILLGEKE